MLFLFENFRNVGLQHYGLDPARNYTSPGLSWQATLKTTDVQLNLLTDLYIYVYFIKCNVSLICISGYPQDLRKDHLIALECLQIEENILNEYQWHLLQEEGFNKSPPKLVPNLRNKTNYIIHYRNLKLYLELGLRLTIVYRVLLFDQLPWLKNYINFNIRQRIAAKNHERDFFKLMKNAVFSKSFIYLFVLLWSYILIHSL